MCREDVLFMRNTRIRTTTVDVQLTSTQLLAGDPNRIAIILGPPPTNAYSLGFGTAAILNQGVTMLATSNPFVLDIKDVGALVTCPLNAISAVAHQSITVQEVIWIEADIPSPLPPVYPFATTTPAMWQAGRR